MESHELMHEIVRRCRSLTRSIPTGSSKELTQTDTTSRDIEFHYSNQPHNRLRTADIRILGPRYEVVNVRLDGLYETVRTEYDPGDILEVVEDGLEMIEQYLTLPIIESIVKDRRGREVRRELHVGRSGQEGFDVRYTNRAKLRTITTGPTTTHVRPDPEK